jgi:two-component system NtrC family response regulator
MTESPARILLVDDDESLRRVLELQLSEAGFTVVTSGSAEEALQVLGSEGFDLVISDIRMPGMDGLAFLGEIKCKDTDAVAMIITAHGDVETAVQALKEGAFDYLTKPISREVFLHAVNRALNFRRVYFTVARQREALNRRYSFERIVGAAAGMEVAFETVRRAAPSDVTVLIRGETGTGKELFARAIHHNSRRSDSPFVSLNCAAIPEALLESAFFGHEKGSFTSATSQHIGCYEEADGGTLFLDEIGLLSHTLQGKLLRVLESGTLRRVGGDQDIQCDVRIVAATSSPLEAMVHQGAFREDLYFRLRVLEIGLPPLRERTEDIPLLVDHLLVDLEAPSVSIDAPALQRLKSYSWPGNVRELRNVLERCLILRKNETRITSDDLGLESSRPKDVAPSSDEDAVLILRVPKEGIDMEDVERRLLETALEQSKGNRSLAARFLGLGRHALRYRLKKHGLVDDGDGDAQAD